MAAVQEAGCSLEEQTPKRTAQPSVTHRDNRQGIPQGGGGVESVEEK